MNSISARLSSSDKRRAVQVSRVVVALQPRVVDEVGRGFGLGAAGDEADVDRVVDVGTGDERLRTFFRWLQQVPQRRHRAVVQVRRAQPDAVGGRVAVALGLAVGAEIERRLFEGVERGHQTGGERVEPMRIGAELVDVGRDLSRVGAAEIMTPAQLASQIGLPCATLA